MSIRIERIAVENMGPLGTRQIEFGRFNLIYGPNETGKTYLVEFLLHSLFRNASEWILRDIPGQGVVTVSGLEQETTEFRPSSNLRLEDHWEQADLGLPTNMARLLVVKGAELAMDADTPGGIGKDVLKTVLSRERLLDQISDDIQKTILDAEVSQGTIQAAHRGEIKRRQELLDDLRRLNDLFEALEARYSQGPMRSLEIELAAVEAEAEQQRQAKRHLAHQLHEQREELFARRAALPDQPLQELQDTLRDYQGETGELEHLEEELMAKQEASEGYPWVSQAIGVWEGKSLEAPGPPSILITIVAGVLLLAGLAAALTDLHLPALVLFGLGFGAGGYYLWRLTRPGATGADQAEREAIRSGYEERFGEPLGGLAELRERHEELREAQSAARHTQERVQECKQRREELAGAVARQIKALTGEAAPEEEWVEVVEELRQRSRQLDEEMHQVELRLRELAVEPADYRADASDADYDAQRLRELKREQEELERKLHEARRDLESMKQEVCRETEDDISTPWPQVLANLRARRAEVESEYRQQTAEILGQIGVSRVLEQIRAQEDEKIREGLKQPEVLEALQQATGSYDSLDMTDGGIVVSGARGEFPLGALSTGAREQVLLALRLGFAARLAGGKPLFLLLDDAFQHSDWDRRHGLINSVVRLAQEGWQVTYLTMDDHIRDLFCAAGEEHFGDEFAFIEIG